MSDISASSVGDIVAIEAVDWGYENEQLPSSSAFSIVRGTVYGQVILCNNEWVTIAPQVFSDDTVRCALSIPWVTVTKLVILLKGHG